MRVLFVHGMGRTPVSGWLLLHQLRQAGYKTSVFSYAVSLQSFSQIKERLVARLVQMQRQETEELVLVGHSLGGVLLRAALNSLPSQARKPRHLFLLGSPIGPSRVAKRLGGNFLFRAFTRDCGQLLGSASRMSAINEPSVQTTGIAGTKGVSITRGPFGSDRNDGVVSISEVTAPWLKDQFCVPVIHTLLPASRRVGSIILERLRQHGSQVNRAK